MLETVVHRCRVDLGPDDDDDEKAGEAPEASEAQGQDMASIVDVGDTVRQCWVDLGPEVDDDDDEKAGEAPEAPEARRRSQDMGHKRRQWRGGGLEAGVQGKDKF